MTDSKEKNFLRVLSSEMDPEDVRFIRPPHSGTGLIYEMVLVKKLTLEASGH